MTRYRGDGCCRVVDDCAKPVFQRLKRDVEYEKSERSIATMGTPGPTLLYSVINKITPDLSTHTLHINFLFSMVLAELEHLLRSSCCFSSPMVIVAIVTSHTNGVVSMKDDLQPHTYNRSMSDASSSPCKRGAEMLGMEGVEGHGSSFWGGYQRHTQPLRMKGAPVCNSDSNAL